MKEVSILLPSLRPEYANASINNFKLTNDDVDYELIVVSPKDNFQVEGHKTKWVDEGLQPTGSVSATIRAYEKAESDYVMYFSDDVVPTEGCLRKMLDFLKLKSYPCIGAFKMQTIFGKEIGPFGAYNKLYACYGCLNRRTIKSIGGFFNPSYMYSWVDIDMSLRCWNSTGRVEICQEASVIPMQIEDEIYKTHRSQYWSHDVENFLELWHPILGNGYERLEGSVNRRLNVNRPSNTDTQ